MSNPQGWYEFRALAGGAVDVMIYDQVGGMGVSAAAFVKDLKAHRGKDVNLHINSPGGSVFDGTAIYNALKSHKGKVTTHIDGIAASIASVIALAGDEVRIASNGFMMIHEASGLVMGTAADMRRQADVAEKLTGTIANTYAEKTGKPVEEIRALMAAETWFTAEEAVEAGLADAVADAVEFTNSFDLTTFNKAPETLRAKAAATPPQEINPMNLEQFKAFAAANPDATKEFYNAGLAAGVEQGKAEAAPKPATVDEMKAAFANESGFIIDNLNKPLVEAKAAFADVLSGRLATATAEVADLKAKLARQSTGQGAVGFSADAGNAGDGDAVAKFKAKVEEQVKAGKSKAQAFSAVIAADPTLHADYLKAVNARK